MTDYPAVWYIDESDGDIYKELKRLSKVKKWSNKEQFMLALAFGVKSKSRQKLQKPDGAGFFRAEYLNSRDDALLKAVAMWDAQGDFSVLPNPQIICTIAQEYAHAGIKILAGKMKGEFGTFPKQFERAIIDLCDKLGLKPKEENEQNPVS